MTFLRRYILFWLMVVQVVPLVFVFDVTSSYIFAQVTVFQLIIVLLIVPALWYWLWDRSSRPRMTAILLIYLLFIISMIVSSILGVQPLKSFTGVWERFGDVIDWVYLFIFYMLLASFVRSRAEWISYQKVIVLVSTGAAMFAAMQHFPEFGLYFTGSRIFGTLGNPAFLASYLMLTAGIAAFLAFRTPHIVYRVFYLSALIVQLVAVVLTATRAALAGLFFVAVLATIHVIARARGSRSEPATYRRINFMFVALVIIVIALYAFGVRTERSIVSRELILLSDTQTLRERLVNWHIAFQGFLERPIFGWGESNYDVVFQRFYDPSLYEGIHSIKWFDRPHNEFLSRLSDGGMIGLILYFALLGAPLYRAVKRRSHPPSDAREISDASVDDRAVGRGSITHTRHGLTPCADSSGPHAGSSEPLWLLRLFLPGYYVYLFFFFHSIADAVILTTYLAFLSFHDSYHEEALPVSRHRFVSCIALVIGFGCAVVIGVKPIAANILVRAGETSARANAALRHFSSAWNLTNPGKRTIVTASSTRLNRTDAGTVDWYLTQHALRRWLAEIVRLYPLDARLWILSAEVERQFGLEGVPRSERMTAKLNAAKALSARLPAPYHAQGLVYLDTATLATEDDERRSYHERARREFENARMLKPDLHEVQILFLLADELVSDSSGGMATYIVQHAAQLTGADWVTAIEALSYRGDPPAVQAVAEQVLRVIDEQNRAGFNTDRLQSVHTALLALTATP